MRKITFGALAALSLVALGSPGSSADPRRGAEVPSCRGNEVFVVPEFVLEEGETIRAEGCLEIVSHGPIVIAGTLTGAPGTPGAAGGHLILRSASYIWIKETGVVRAGQGYDGVGDAEAGTDAGDLRLEAPIVYVDGPSLTGARGGDGGPGGNGGMGGRIVLRGAGWSLSAEAPLELIGGAGGAGNAAVRSGGRGGAGGSVSGGHYPMPRGERGKGDAGVPRGSDVARSGH